MQFRKHLRPEDLGAKLYEALRIHLQSDGELSLGHLLRSLDLEPASLHEQHSGDAMVGLMFAAALAAERSASPRVAEQIVAGMKLEFLQHLREQGATDLQRAQWEETVATMFLQYRTCMEGYTGFEPPWKLGRLFFWNIVSKNVYDAMSIKISTLYLMAARDAAQSVLNVFGPVLLLPTGS